MSWLRSRTRAPSSAPSIMPALRRRLVHEDVEARGMLSGSSLLCM